MTLRLNGSTSGYTEIDAPAVAGSNTLVLPGGNGSADQALVTNGSGTLSFADRGRMVLETAKPSTSGTSVDFTSIPSWVKRVTVMFDGVSTSATSPVLIQLGTGSTPTYTTSGYLGSVCVIAADGSTARTTYTTGFLVTQDAVNTHVHHGNINITNITGNTWTQNGLLAQSDSNRTHHSAGSIALAAVLTAVRITTVGGTHTFDNGAINLLLEG